MVVGRAIALQLLPGPDVVAWLFTWWVCLLPWPGHSIARLGLEPVLCHTVDHLLQCCCPLQAQQVQRT
jgi:hypothetical protein